ncbi:MAG: ArsR family transcriptional regulator [Chloroflexota bacterium]|nr:MAG: ArsR family transcriptional regulator [Chloroflexota bacterium]
MTTREPQPKIEILWDWGTAYDLFVSLHVLNNPEKFGLRASWAAGVRSRLPLAERKILEEAEGILPVPLHWLHTLPEPKDGATALWMLSKIPAEERLPTLAISPEISESAANALREVAESHSWNDDTLDRLRTMYPHKPTMRPKEMACLLDWWSQPGNFGERYLGALQAYQAAFFAEEELRIRPVIKGALAQAQDLAARLPVEDLLEELSQGVHFTDLGTVDGLVLVPSYWSTPFIVYASISARKGLVLFGARPVDANLIPGETIPDSILRALKALADPTRLQILRYLSHESLTPSQLSRLLRLRMPTILHHLSALRLAGLVQLTLEVEGERRYALRTDGMSAAFDGLFTFLNIEAKE